VCDLAVRLLPPLSATDPLEYKYEEAAKNDNNREAVAGHGGPANSWAIVDTTAAILHEITHLVNCEIRGIGGKL